MKNKKNLLCFFSLLLTSISELFVIEISIKMGNAIDNATLGKVDGLMRTCLMLVIFIALNNILFLLSVFITQLYIKEITIGLVSRLVNELIQKPLFDFRKKDDSYYNNIIMSDIDNVAKNYYGMIPVEVKFIILSLGSIVAMFTIEPRLFIISLCFAIIPILVTYLFEKKLQVKTKECSNQKELVYGDVYQFITGYEMQKINNCNGSILNKKIYKSFNNKINKEIERETIQCASYMSIDVVNSIGKLILIGIGGYLIIQGKITAGQLVTCTVLTQYLCSGINNYLEIHIGRKALLPIKNKIENEYNPLKENTVQYSLTDGSNIEYKNVSFGFDSQKEKVLKNINYNFESGKSYAIIGESGIGKSTFMKLLLKYYANYEGEILLNGVDIKLLADNDLYKYIGYLNQNEVILNENLKNNITLLDSYDFETTKYNNILKKVCLENFSQKVGDRKLGEFGETISGGERQRVALARILYRNPPILVLDEPLSGIDEMNQKIILDAFFQMNEKTRIMITHNVSDELLSRFDYVINIKDFSIH